MIDIGCSVRTSGHVCHFKVTSDDVTEAVDMHGQHLERVHGKARPMGPSNVTPLAESLWKRYPELDEVPEEFVKQEIARIYGGPTLVLLSPEELTRVVLRAWALEQAKRDREKRVHRDG